MQQVRPDLLGFVFHLSWLYLLMYSDAVVTTRGSSLVSAGDEPYLASAIMLALAMAVGIACTKRFMRVCESRAGSAGAPAVTTIGTVLYCAAQFTEGPGLMLAGGVLTGIGSGMLAARWASVFGGASARATVENLPTLFAAIVVICASTNFIPYEMNLALVVVLPLLSGAALQFARKYQRSLRSAAGEDDSKHDERSAKQSRPVRESTHINAPLATLAQVAFVALTGATIAALPSLAAAGFDYGTLFYAFSGLFALLFCAVSIARVNPRSMFTLFFIPTLVLLAALLPLFDFGNNIENVLQPVGNIAFELILLFGCVLLARITDASPARTFMIGRLTLAMADLVGSWAGMRIYQAADSVVVAQTAGILLFVACELLLAALVVAFFVTGGSRKLGARTDGEKVTAPDGEDNAPAAANAQNAEAAAAPLADAPCAATLPGDKREHDAAADHHARADAPEPSPLDAIAERFGLSERERDVFALLAEGRTNARIGEDLCIAAGTVNYHTRNIYQKLGVHSRQELIDLVRNA